MIIQPILNIAEICAKHGVLQAVLCPGSRSAPLTLAFARHPDIDTLVIPDERSAAFIGLGLAQASNKPVALICTSGTAAANFNPAIIEAFYRQVPLLIFTADRPPEWTDQQDGQTIRQQNIYQNHIRGFYQFPVSFDHDDARWHSSRIITEAIIKATGEVRGPVHINVPVREPFYPAPDERFHFDSDVAVFRANYANRLPETAQTEKWQTQLAKYKRVLVVAGQGTLPDELVKQLNRVQQKLHWPVVGDITSNIHGLENAISKHDSILENGDSQNALQPDLIITFGQSVLSKKLKLFLRSQPARDHWHVGHPSSAADVFQSLTEIIVMDPEAFFAACAGFDMQASESQSGYYNLWQGENTKATAAIENYFTQKKSSEFHAVQTILQALPATCILHLANSMPVRYASMIGLQSGSQIEVHSNRGTSGIDGCVSTAVGHAINTDKLNILLTGDVAFFYDRNGLWHEYLPDNLRIILLNNRGGGIFRLIDGPKNLDEREQFFATHQQMHAENTARDFNMNYVRANGSAQLASGLKTLLNPDSGCTILEYESDPEQNVKAFEAWKVFMQNQ